MKSRKRQARRLPLPDGPTLNLVLDDGSVLIFDRMPDNSAVARIAGVTPKSAYCGHGYLVTISRSLHPEFGQLLHVVISHESGQLPPWYVVKALKAATFPENVGAVLPLPESSNYVNIAECFQLIQMPSEWGNL